MSLCSRLLVHKYHIHLNRLGVCYKNDTLLSLKNVLRERKMCKKTRVSIVVPTRDNLDLLPKAYDSIKAQNIADIEIIIADDGSVDGTAQWLEAQMALEPRLRVLQTGGKGPANARNQAIAVATAPLIAFLDANDWWHTGKLKLQLGFMEQNPAVGFSFTDYLHIDETGKHYPTCFEYWQPVYGNRPPQGYDILPHAEAELLGCNTAGTSTIIARTNVLQQANGFATHLRSAEDWDLWLRLANIAPVACTSIIGTTYLMRKNSETSRHQDRLDATLNIIDSYRSSHDPLLKAAVRKAEAKLYAARADIARLKGDYWSAVAAELHAIINAPSMRDVRAAASDAVHGVRDLIGRLGNKQGVMDKKAA